MSCEEMELLSYAIREFLIEHVAKTGGHLASNLGVVELTLALHRLFDSPEDKIIWDVGHQSYVHKILTGRAEDFDTLRQFGGLSGFPKGKESVHDAFDTGHSSTSISAAAGYAAARDIQGKDYEVIAVIGDGSLTGGMAYEALNNIGASKSKVIVILNDNGMSISPNIGGISRHLGSLRTSKGYLSAKNFIKNKISTIPSIGKGLAQGLADLKNDIPTTGISQITGAEIAAAAAEDCKLKLIAHASIDADGKITASVAPEKLPVSHPLAGVCNEFNAVYVTGDMVGELMFYGKGAGALPTGSAVVGDLIGIAKRL